MRFRLHGRMTGALRLVEPLLGLTLKRQFTRQCKTLKRVLGAAPHEPAKRPRVVS
ncbi:MAG TPA: hypothetical protein VNA28_13175 [Solirubrobacteraceae bacterium]|nr:hypothetical protein [Solirubrobacteraceae bacterium]